MTNLTKVATLPKIATLLVRYPDAPVDRYAIYLAAEAIARHLQCAKQDILDGALNSEKAANVLLKVAENYTGPVEDD